MFIGCSFGFEDARNCEKLQNALLQRYFTELGYRERFRKAKPEGQRFARSADCQNQ